VREALRLVGELHPDVLLGDIGLPLVDGGYQRHLTKPVDSGQLVAAITETLRDERESNARE
jgi:CheY-like chemotaxis protein